MKLSVVERITLLQILPQQGDFLTLRIIHELRQALSFTEDEIAEFGLEVDPEKSLVRWNQQATRDVEMPIGVKANRIIVDTLLELDNNKKLTEGHLSLYEKFCSGEEQEDNPPVSLRK
jgi:hypothetical protein